MVWWDIIKGIAHCWYRWDVLEWTRCLEWLAAINWTRFLNRGNHVLGRHARAHHGQHCAAGGGMETITNVPTKAVSGFDMLWLDSEQLDKLVGVCIE